jgi:hypothetical protein
MDFLSIGIGLLGVSSTLILKGVSYVRNTDRAIMGLSLQLKEHVVQSQGELAEIKASIAQLQRHLDLLGADDDYAEH